VVLKTALMTFARLMNWVLARVILVDVAMDGILALGFCSLKSMPASTRQGAHSSSHLIHACTEVLAGAFTSAHCGFGSGYVAVVDGGMVCNARDSRTLKYRQSREHQAGLTRKGREGLEALWQVRKARGSGALLPFV